MEVKIFVRILRELVSSATCGSWNNASENRDEVRLIMDRVFFHSMNHRKFHPGQIALLVGVGILGFMLGRRSDIETGKGEAPPGPAQVEQTKAPVEKRVAPIESTSQAVPTGAEMKIAPRLAKLQSVVDLNRVLNQKISVSMLSGDELDKDFVALFGLSSDEVKTLKDAVVKAKAQLAELEGLHARIEPKGGDKFTITIPDFPKEGGVVFDEFTKTVRATLGEDRFAYYKTISRFEAEHEPAFGGFGLTQTVINLEDAGGKNAMMGANWSVGPDPESGGMTKTANMGIYFLKTQYPVIYRKMTDAGVIPPSTGK